MKVINIHQAKARLSEYLEAAARGEKVLICKRNTPVAELRAVAPARSARRPIGRAQGGIEVPESFFEPLPDEVLDTFGAAVSSSSGAARVADTRPASYRPRARQRRKPR